MAVARGRPAKARTGEINPKRPWETVRSLENDPILPIKRPVRDLLRRLPLKGCLPLGRMVELKSGEDHLRESPGVLHSNRPSPDPPTARCVPCDPCFCRHWPSESS